MVRINLKQLRAAQVLAFGRVPFCVVTLLIFFNVEISAL